jgi:hypothetical protein
VATMIQPIRGSVERTREDMIREGTLKEVHDCTWSRYKQLSKITDARKI